MYKDIPIDKLKLAKWNYKKDDQDLMTKLVANIKRNGVVENIIVREMDDGYYEVVNGNHRVMALRELGYEKVKAYDLGKISLHKAKLIAIETNETRFDPDPDLLAGLVSSLLEDFQRDDLLETLPFSEEELKNFENIFDLDRPKKDRAQSSSTSKKDESDEEDLRGIADMLYGLGIHRITEDEAEMIERAYRLAGSNFERFVLDAAGGVSDANRRE